MVAVEELIIASHLTSSQMSSYYFKTFLASSPKLNLKHSFLHDVTTYYRPKRLATNTSDSWRVLSYYGNSATISFNKSSLSF